MSLLCRIDTNQVIDTVSFSQRYENFARLQSCNRHFQDRKKSVEQER